MLHSIYFTKLSHPQNIKNKGLAKFGIAKFLHKLLPINRTNEHKNLKFQGALSQPHFNDYGLENFLKHRDFLLDTYHKIIELFLQILTNFSWQFISKV